LHIQGRNTKRFSPVAVDSIIRDCVFCPNILLHTQPQCHKILLHTQNPATHFVLQNTVFKALIYGEAYSFWGTKSTNPPTVTGLCPWTPLGDTGPPDPLPRPPNVRHNWPSLIVMTGTTCVNSSMR